MCDHLHFAAEVNVGRVLQGDAGPVLGIIADVSIVCADCGHPFVVKWTEPAYPDTIPLDIAGQNKRPWVSGMGQIMGFALEAQSEQEPWKRGNVPGSGIIQ
jgi:hypothetical protein